jgi:hypothetical protein
MCNRKSCVLLLAVLASPLLPAYAQDRALTAQEMEQRVQQRAGERRKTQAAEKAYIEKLDAAVRGTPADPRATETQRQKLRESITKAGPALQRSMSRLDCRDRKCAVGFRLSQGASGQTRTRELSAIEDWAAWSQSCAYTSVHDPAASGGSVQVFIDCAQ